MLTRRRTLKGLVLAGAAPASISPLRLARRVSISFAIREKKAGRYEVAAGQGRTRGPLGALQIL